MIFYDSLHKISMILIHEEVDRVLICKVRYQKSANATTQRPRSRRTLYNLYISYYTYLYNAAPEKRAFSTESSIKRRKHRAFPSIQKAAMVGELSAGKSHRTVVRMFNTNTFDNT